jgi:hypothetical protein
MEGCGAYLINMTYIEESALPPTEIEAIVKDTVRHRIFDRFDNSFDQLRAAQFLLAEAVAVEHQLADTVGRKEMLPAKPRSWFPTAAVVFGQCSIFGIFLVALVTRHLTDMEIGDATGVSGIAVGTMIFIFLNPTPFFKKTSNNKWHGILAP